MQDQPTTESVFNSVMAWLRDHPIVHTAVGVVVLVLLAYLADVIAKRQLTRIIRRVASRTSFTWDDYVIQNRVFDRLAQIVPGLVVYYGVTLIPGLPAGMVTVVQSVSIAFMVLMVMLAVAALLTAANQIYEQYPVAKQRPIKGYTQVGKIVLYILGGVVIVASLMNQSPLLFLSGIGAMTAVLLLIFKDTILSLVASVQLTSNDMVRVGDWIEMPKYGADGDVVDIALHTVKVQNFDKTVTTIPTHALIADSFKNWRHMKETGGRRIKRALYLDTGSIRFLSDNEVKRFEQFSLLEEYVDTKRRELEAYNTRLGGDANGNVNARRLTNIGTFRAYCVNYLKHHPKVHNDFTMLVRQLQPGPQGLPLEIYVFTSDTAWAVYEGIQADVFDHLMAIVPEFGLRLFQNPSGGDVRALVARSSNGHGD
jgi:miniconductance mechanosensitive channel